jgi:hypothetical protein
MYKSEQYWKDLQRAFEAGRKKIDHPDWDYVYEDFAAYRQKLEQGNRPQVVLVKDGKTTNLKYNRWAVNGDLEGVERSKSTPLLPDGEYPATAFEPVMQIDDSRGVWIMAPDEQYALAHGWPTRNTYYYFTENIQYPGLKSCLICLPDENI